MGAVIGALAGSGLSFTALSPLVVGGVIGTISPALLALVAIRLRYCYRDEINKFKKEEGIVEKDVIVAFMPPFLLATIASIAIGIGLATTANVVLHGIFATGWAIAVGAGIGALALPTGIVTGVTVSSMFVAGMHEYIISDERVI